MKVYPSEAMQEADRRAINEAGIPGLTLMENAGSGCASLIHERYNAPTSKKAVVIAGKGNNGGDGYVIARLLQHRGWHVTTFVLADRSEINGDALSNLERLPPDDVRFCPLGIAPHAGELAEATTIVDAIFGTGLTREITGPAAETINIINAAGRPVVAVDIPSGIHGTTGRLLGTAIRADLTVTFGGVKSGHVQHPGIEYTGELKVIEIGIPPTILAEIPGYEYVNDTVARGLIRPRGRTAHKGSCGHVLIVAGSRGKTGAAAMSANSAIRCGSGLVTLAAPATLNDILEVKTTEAMTVPLDDAGRGYLSSLALPGIQAVLPGKNAVALGPGLSRNAETAALICTVLKEINLPAVLDADAINAVAQQPESLRTGTAHPIILTPHPGEMSRLMGIPVARIEADRIAAARDTAAHFGVFIILKGAGTICAAPDGRVSINGSGNPGMASGGMGDVLTGILVSLVGQGYQPFEACMLAVYLHGYAADLVAADKGEIGINATDVQERLPYAYKALQ